LEAIEQLEAQTQAAMEESEEVELSCVLLTLKVIEDGNGKSG
jgi:hypothetical protein